MPLDLTARLVLTVRGAEGGKKQSLCLENEGVLGWHCCGSRHCWGTGGFGAGQAPPCCFTCLRAGQRARQPGGAVAVVIPGEGKGRPSRITCLPQGHLKNRIPKYVSCP